MALENVKLEKKNQIAYVTIDRPKVLNALNMATMQELWQVFSELKDDKQIRVVILTGGGEKAFVAGADINELAKNNPVEAKAYTHKGQATLDLIENLGKPVIGCINGFALGGGCEIAMACTMRLASENCQAGPARGEAGHHSRLRRHAAAAAPCWNRPGHANSSYRRDDYGAGSAPHRTGK